MKKNVSKNKASQSSSAVKATPAASKKTASTLPKLPPATPLSFSEFFEPGAQELKPSQKLLGLNGKRVVMGGYMAEMEEPVEGHFFLCPVPSFNDEMGGGTGDLPPSAILVIAPFKAKEVIPHTHQPMKLTGTLRLGLQTLETGYVSRIQLVLDPPQPQPKVAAKPTTAKKTVKPKTVKATKPAKNARRK